MRKAIITTGMLSLILAASSAAAQISVGGAASGAIGGNAQLSPAPVTGALNQTTRQVNQTEQNTVDHASRMTRHTTHKATSAVDAAGHTNANVSTNVSADQQADVAGNRVGGSANEKASAGADVDASGTTHAMTHMTHAGVDGATQHVQNANSRAVNGANAVENNVGHRVGGQSLNASGSASGSVSGDAASQSEGH